MGFADEDLVKVCPYCASKRVSFEGFFKMYVDAGIEKLYCLHYQCLKCKATFFIEKTEELYDDEAFFDW